jgi:hypothetical protein
MTGKMPRSAAKQSALDAPFGLGRCRYRYSDKCDHNRGTSKYLVRSLLPTIKTIDVETTRLSRKFQVNARPAAVRRCFGDVLLIRCLT